MWFFYFKLNLENFSFLTKYTLVNETYICVQRFSLSSLHFMPGPEGFHSTLLNKKEIGENKERGK